jgi:isoleucyl-tRNA synthetase
MIDKSINSKAYPDVAPNPDFPKIEENVLASWKKEGLFQRSIDNRKAAKEFIFYDGPPFANGLPHYGHLLTGFVKDLFARYQTMKGRRVERRFGWDCHGLPAEMGSEKELGISGRQAIINFGIDKLNEHCRTSVMKYTQEWEDYVTRQARWVDFKNDYKTMDINFMESVLWAFKQLYDKGLVYEAYRVMPYSWAAETPLSNFETKLDNSYREREDKAIYVTFELNEVPSRIRQMFEGDEINRCKVIAWTTTPWTLPSNLALAVNKDIQYTAWLNDDVCYIAATSVVNGNSLAGQISLPIAQERREDGTIPTCAYIFKGGDLLGLTYKPLFPYFKDHKNAFRILDGSAFVTDADGTGIVHMAPGFGEDDQKCCEANGIELVVPVDGQGKFTDEIYDLPDLQLKGLNVIAENVEKFKFGEANERIIRWLKDHGSLIKQEQIKHNYPHCWRTDQPLIYRAMPSWYVEVTKFRDRAVEINKQINWIPDHIRDGQMGHMLATAPDWSISRNRFWGTPIPVWRSKSGKIKVFGSIAELEKASGQKITDLHRPYIDEIVIKEGGEEYTRVDDVFDCWFESGSMPFAQVHYPFENKEWFEKHFPADFITEYVGQTRGWFNTLIMLSTALFDKAPFKNCICHGVMLGESAKDENTGKMVAQKLSKRLKNYPEPFKVFDEYGADALRWFLISSSVMRGNDLQIDKEGKFIRDVVRLSIKPIWNAYNFFTLYANADGIKAKLATDSQDVMDRYILAKCKQAVETIEKSLDAYDTSTACDAVMQFFEALNNWYIRRNKERFWSNLNDANTPQEAFNIVDNIIGGKEDKQAAYDTLYTVLITMCRAAAPLLPLTLDEIYKSLTGEPSVHLADFPPTEKIDPNDVAHNVLIWQMDLTRDICNAALAIRNIRNIRVRQPLLQLVVAGGKALPDNFKDIIKEEINVKDIRFDPDFLSYATFKLQINPAVLGKRLPEKMKQILPAAKKGEWQRKDGVVSFTIENIPVPLFPIEYALTPDPHKEYKDRAQALSTNDALVILDTTITPELEAEGFARDMVRAIQQARKDAGLHVSDRIALHLDGPQAIIAAVGAHKSYVMEQTLSAQILDTKPASQLFSTESEIDGKKVRISIAMAT